MISPLNGFQYYEIEWRLLGKKGVRGKRRNLSYNWSAFSKNGRLREIFNFQIIKEI
jgi:hypothetical protein